MLTCKRGRFTLPENKTYLNCGFLAPLLKNVERAGIRAIHARRDPSTMSSTDFFDTSQTARQLFANLINAPYESVALIPSASYGMATAANLINLNAGEEILMAGNEFPSGYYIWARKCKLAGGHLRMIPPPEGPGCGARWNAELLAAITAATKLVVISQAHWTDGTLFDLKALRAKTLTVGAKLVLDGTQSIGVIPMDVKELQPDVVVCAGYKWLFGPYGMGYAYFDAALHEGLPLEENWINRQNSEDFTNLINYRDEYQPGALRYDSGEHSNFILLPMAISALDQVTRWKPEQISNYCRALTAPAIAELKSAGFLIEEDEWRAPHLFGIRLRGVDNLLEIKKRLAEKKVSVSFRGSAIRVSVSVFNRKSDLDKLVRVLTR